MRTERMDIHVYRNADYFEAWQINDAEGVPISLVDRTLELRVRAAAGQGAIIASALIDLYDPTNCIFTVRIDGSALSTVAGAGEVVRLAYDLRLTYGDGVQAIPVAGQIILTPGVSF